MTSTAEREARRWLTSQLSVDENTSTRVLTALRGAEYPEDSWLRELQAMHGDGSIAALIGAATTARTPRTPGGGGGGGGGSSSKRWTSKKKKRKEFIDEKAELTRVIAAELRSLGVAPQPTGHGNGGGQVGDRV